MITKEQMVKQMKREIAFDMTTSDEQAAERPK